MRPKKYCFLCKGTKNLCGLGYCPVLKRLSAQSEARRSLGTVVFGETGEIFVGSSNYPAVSWGPVLPRDRHLGERELYERGYSEIIMHRANVVRGKRFGGIRPGRRIVAETREAAMSVKPIDLELTFSKVPQFDMRFSSVAQPIGGAAPMRKVRLCDNPRIPRRVDELSGEGLKAKEAVEELYSEGMGNYYLTSLLSAGVLGSHEKRKMVPTRWSITATDDMLGKMLAGKVREYPEVQDFYLMSHHSLSNHFEILVLPGRWEFENFEAWAPGTVWTGEAAEPAISVEYEPFGGRSRYAESQAGAYYAVRLAVLEFLKRIRRQGRVVAIREVHDGYQVPVGVFQVRENVRDATLCVKKCSTLQEALEVLSGRLKNGMDGYVRRSRVVGQRRLGDFL